MRLDTANEQDLDIQNQGKQSKGSSASKHLMKEYHYLDDILTKSPLPGTGEEKS